ncbi:hypothetical protein [Sulfurimonas sp. HSL3-7]|uniref:hypothetical protein n=1 Tax=Sulfonitrofixus jiaomeiensis TaxID=3131938 RepID=UPI0031F7C476
MKKPDIIQTIMTGFSERSCISGVGCIPVRYLWTDAFAVCNFLELFRRTGEQRYKEEALLLVDQVHHVLGQHRSDDSRSGWISGLENKEGELHPTIGGLRIGKKSNERKFDAPYNERLEWEQDGQYFHYLTKWMHALNLVTQVTGDFRYNRWALELAKTAHGRFTYTIPGNEKRMYWKMSIDLSYPLVPSMGQHDALDGYITYLQLVKTASEDPQTSHELHLESEIAEMAEISQAVNWATDDPLGIGGLLSDAFMLTQLIIAGSMEHLSDMFPKLLAHAKSGIDLFMRTDTLKYPPHYRLAFRELGLSIGLHAIEKTEQLFSEHADCFADRLLLQSQLKELNAYLPLCEIIENFWMKPENQKSSTWNEHLDINSVMLATSLDPDGYLMAE